MRKGPQRSFGSVAPKGGFDKSPAGYFSISSEAH